MRRRLPFLMLLLLFNLLDRTNISFAALQMNAHSIFCSKCRATWCWFASAHGHGWRAS